MIMIGNEILPGPRSYSYFAARILAGIDRAAEPKYRRPSVANNKYHPVHPFCMIVESGTSKAKVKKL
jgi:hypothetical protein